MIAMMTKAIQNFRAMKTNGRYEFTWPWKEDIPKLPDNYQLASGQLNFLSLKSNSRKKSLRK